MTVDHRAVSTKSETGGHNGAPGVDAAAAASAIISWGTTARVTPSPKLLASVATTTDENVERRERKRSGAIMATV
jgi:hypothetical protein